VEALDLAAGLGMVGPRVLGHDAELFQERFEGGRPFAWTTLEDRAIEFLSDVKPLQL
jgi:hypothetical protein